MLKIVLVKLFVVSILRKRIAFDGLLRRTFLKYVHVSVCKLWKYIEGDPPKSFKSTQRVSFQLKKGES